MKTYKKNYFEDENTLTLSALVGLLLLTLSFFIFSAISNIEDIEILAFLSFMLAVAIVGAIINYGIEENIRLRFPQPGETIEILFTKKVVEFDSSGDEYEKIFYLYSVDEVIYSDEREPTLLEIGKKYFVNKDGGLELKGR